MLINLNVTPALALGPLLRRRGFTALAILLLVIPGASIGLQGASLNAPEATTEAPKENALAGLWYAEASPPDPTVRGDLRIEDKDGIWQAHIAVFSVPVIRDHEGLRFKLPDGKGEFRGRLEPDNHTILGHWIQPGGPVSYHSRATPVELSRSGDARWVGTVVPLDETLHLYVQIQRRPDGSLTSVIRNHENNRWRRSVFTVKLDDDDVLLTAGRQQIHGRFDPHRQELSLALNNTASVVFKRATETEAAGFYPRTTTPNTFRYQKPETVADGWSTASLNDVALAPEPIRALIQTILDADPADPQTIPIHSLLIARRGKLVLEEYFHGFNRERPHDMRSAGKTFAPLLVGVARDHGAKVEPQTLVTDLFPEYRPFAHWDARKARLTVQDLMTMTSGLASDDTDAASPGQEDRLQEQEAEPDWYRYTLNLPMVRDSGGTKAVYSSATLNLVGGVAGRVAGEWNGDLFSRHVARPLQFGRYHLNLMPTGEVYTGGGAYLLPRDQLKLGQLYLNGGLWNGTRVLSKEWVDLSVVPHATFEKPMNELDLNHQYGYGWHVYHFTVGGRTYRQYAAGGNGGQFIMAFPDLDMVVAINAAGYGSGAWYRWGQEVIPKYLIPAAAGSDSRETSP